MNEYEEIELNVNEIIDQCASDREALTETFKKLGNVYRAIQRETFGFNKHNEKFMDTLIIRTKGRSKISSSLRFNFREFQRKISEFLTVGEEKNIEEKLANFLRIETSIQCKKYEKIDFDHNEANRYKMKLLPKLRYQLAHLEKEEEKEGMRIRITAVEKRMKNEALYVDMQEFLFNQKKMYSSFVNNSEKLNELIQCKKIAISKIEGLDAEKFTRYVLEKIESKTSIQEEKGFPKEKVNG